MTNLITFFIFGALFFLFLTLLKQRFIEHYTSNEEYEDTEVDEVDEDDEFDEDDENDEDEEDEETEEIEEINVSNSDSEKKYKPVYINESNISDTIIIKDSLRRDSKVSSSLNFTYIDENCSNISKPTFSDEPIEKVSVEPKTPLVKEKCDNIKNFPSWNESKCKKSGPGNLNFYQKDTNNDASFYSEMFDDSDLKPKPNLDSPYGFVYFPNKYWKQWQNKSRVCRPVSECKVLPTYTEGTTVDVLDYTQIGSMMPKFEYHEEYESK